ncbi:MAG: hypothetical protein R3B90_07255 [Planctomycetaceae bacterium]
MRRRRACHRAAAVAMTSLLRSSGSMRLPSLMDGGPPTSIAA